MLMVSEPADAGAVVAAKPQGGDSAAAQGGEVNIDRLAQSFYWGRTRVTSFFHNARVAFEARFGDQWHPTEERIWLLGRRYRPPVALQPEPFAGGAGGSLPSALPEHVGAGGGCGSRPSGGGSFSSSGGGVAAGDASPSDPWTGIESVGAVGAGGAGAGGAAGAVFGGVAGGGAGGSGGRRKEAEEEEDWSDDRESGSTEEFFTAWSQISRMTYREGFAPMYRCVSDEPRRYVTLTSDAGWGCMIRVGQMLLATALKRHQHLGGLGASRSGSSADGRGRRQAGAGGDAPRAEALAPAAAAAAGGGAAGAFAAAAEEGLDDAACWHFGEVAADALPPLERQFLDDPSPQRSPFSIFSFIRMAQGHEVARPLPVDEANEHQQRGPRHASAPRPRKLTQKLPGDWFGPTTISETIQALVESNGELSEHLAVYVDSDGMLYEDEVRALASGADPNLLQEQHLSSLQPPLAEAPSAPPLSKPSTVAPSAPPLRGGNDSQRGMCTQQPVPLRVLGGANNVVTAAGAKHCSGGADSDDEYMVISTPSIITSPNLCSVQTPPVNFGDSPLVVSMDNCDPEGARADFEMEMKGLELLPPPSVPLGEESPFASLQLGPGASQVRSPQGGGGAAASLAPPLPAPDRPGAATGGADGAAGGADGAAAGAAGGDGSATRWQRAVLLLFPLQLGLDKYVSESSVSAMLRYFELRASLGAMGGRPRHAHYFVGRQGRSLLFVDPHFVQPAAVGAPSSSPSPPAACAGEPGGLGGDESAEDAALPRELGSQDAGVAAGVGGGFRSSEVFANTPKVQIIPAEQIDSSISFAFYCQSEEDFTQLIEELGRVGKAEANAPIRSDPTRPQRLRVTQALCSLAEADVEDVSTPGLATLEGSASFDTSLDTSAAAANVGCANPGASGYGGAEVGAFVSLWPDHDAGKPRSTPPIRPSPPGDFRKPEIIEPKIQLPLGDGRLMVCPAAYADGKWQEVEADGSSWLAEAGGVVC